jgi:tetratricopeptide (TPR) repeat protein
MRRCLLAFFLVGAARAALEAQEKDPIQTTATTTEDAMFFQKRGVHSQYHLQDPVSAAVAYERAAEILKPSDCLHFDCSGMLNDLGILRKSFGDLNGAEKAFLMAIELSSDSASAMANLAEIKVSQGKVNEAAVLYRQANLSPKLTPEILFNYGRFLSVRTLSSSLTSLCLCLSDLNTPPKRKQPVLTFDR